MKKKSFKLIKSYPNSENVGSVYTKTDLCENYWYFTNCLSPADVENNPEFFEEIIDKEYEILSFKCDEDLVGSYITKGTILHKNESDEFKCGIVSASEEKLLTLPHWKINSIRRLSDNEVFSIGDVLIDTFNKSQGSFTLKEIEFEKAPCDKGTGKLSFIHTHPILGKYIPLERLQKAKPVLFVTEDGVEMFSGDKFWKNNGWLEPKCFIAGKDQPYVLNDKPFSSKEKAEEYIMYNKPVLSINDVLQHIRHFSKTLDEDGLKELVESRL